MSPTGDLSRLFDRHRVLVCVGAGGVGKTTVAAALALAAAKEGRRTLCLTIDPARRLAKSLGIGEFPREELQVSDAFLTAHDIQLKAPLTVMMLDVAATFDGLIRKFASTESEAERILKHRIYRHLSVNLAGTQAYMAMEKVLDVLQDDRFDLVVLDTPPSARALDFFDAPKKMAAILDSPATSALSQVLKQGGKLQTGLLGVGIRRAFRGLEAVTGASLIFEIAELLNAMNGLFGGFARRAKEVDSRLRLGEFGYVLVTAPLRWTILDARILASDLSKRDLGLGALIVNRCASQGVSDASEADVSGWVFGTEPGLSPGGAQEVAALAREEAQAFVRQQDACRPLLSQIKRDVPRAFLPAFPEDVHEPEKLMQVADLLTTQLSSG